MAPRFLFLLLIISKSKTRYNPTGCFLLQCWYRVLSLMWRYFVWLDWRPWRSWDDWHGYIKYGKGGRLWRLLVHLLPQSTYADLVLIAWVLSVICIPQLLSPSLIQDSNRDALLCNGRWNWSLADSFLCQVHSSLSHVTCSYVLDSFIFLWTISSRYLTGKTA